MLEQLASLEQVYALCQDDPVRAHIPADQRLQNGKDVLIIRDDKENITAVIYTRTHKFIVLIYSNDNSSVLFKRIQ